MPGFHDTLFPLDISKGSRGGPEYQTRIVTTTGGYESRNIEWSSARGKWNVAFGVRSETDIDTLLAFFHARQGRAYSFRFRDPLDHTATLQPLQTNGDGAVQLAKVYTSGSTSVVRFLTLPVAGTVTGLPGGASVNTTTGIVTGASAGTVVSFTFDLKCRFDNDFLDGQAVRYELASWDDIPVIEVR